jgi:hypothetical protein
MNARGRRKTLWHRSFQQFGVLLIAWVSASGCVGPRAVRYTRMRYNEVVRDTNDQQLLMNIVRLRYAVPVHGPNLLFSKFVVSLYDPSTVEASDS